MRIGIDATCWWNRRGFGRFARGLMKAMFASPRGHQFWLFIDQPPESDMAHPHVRVVQLQVQKTVTKSAVAGSRRSLRDMWRFYRAVTAAPLDVMFFPAVYSWFPVGGRLPTVVTLHDAIAERFPKLIFPDFKGRLFWSTKVWLACQRASSILTVSQAAKQDIVQHIGLAPERIDVICEGVESWFRPANEQSRRADARRRAGIPLDGRLILNVGAPAPHKNLASLITAFAEIASITSDLRLVLVGDPTGNGFYSNYEHLMAQVEADARLKERVHFAGFVPDDDLPALYSDALVAVFPSFAEGFGLPALEAMACGTPVLTSNTGALPEVVGNAGLTFDPHHPSAIAAQIQRVANDPSLLAELRANTLPRVRNYSWSKAAELVFANLEKLARTVG